MIYTVLIAVCKIGAIWSKGYLARRTFHSFTAVFVMLAVLEYKKNIENNGKKRYPVHKEPRNNNGKNNKVDGDSPDSRY